MKNETQTAIADYRSCSDRTRNLQQLRQAGFSYDQIRALSAVMRDAAWEEMFPSMERVDRRFSAMKRDMDGLERRVDQLERRADNGLRRRPDGGAGRWPGEAEWSVVTPERGSARLQPIEWTFLAVLGSGLAGVAAALALAG